MKFAKYKAVGFFVALFLLSVANLGFTSDEIEHENKEELETLREIPLQVRATILEEVIKEIDALEVDDFEREKKEGKEVYEVEMDYGDREIELKISADGTLIQKTVELEKED